MVKKATRMSNKRPELSTWNNNNNNNNHNNNNNFFFKFSKALFRSNEPVHDVDSLVEFELMQARLRQGSQDHQQPIIVDIQTGQGPSSMDFPPLQREIFDPGLTPTNYHPYCGKKTGMDANHLQRGFWGAHD